MMSSLLVMAGLKLAYGALTLDDAEYKLEQLANIPNMRQGRFVNEPPLLIISENHRQSLLRLFYLLL